MTTFQSLGLDNRLIESVTSLGFVTPTPIQEKAIPTLLSGARDFIGLAQTGTGKTAAFGLPLLQLIDTGSKKPQALIICPTRELCIQITNDLNTFKPKKEAINITAVYGGTSIGDQIKTIKKGSSIIVATPGRLIDLIERKAIRLDEILYVVLDEADEMLNMGFQEDIEFILSETVNRQSLWLFSATMPVEIKKVTKKYMQKPFEITIGKVNAANINIDHQYYLTQHNNRYETLKRIIDFNPGIYGLIFTRTKADAQQITEELIREGYDIEALHGDLTQAQRDKVMGRFREKSLQLLIATDVAARGIDVQGITHVINYELPDDIEVYTHRSGRTGRAGRKGIAISIVSPKEVYRLKQVEKLINNEFHKMDIPGGKDVCRKQFYHFIDKMLETDISHGEYETYVPMLREKFKDIDKEEVLQRVAALEFDRFLKYYENAVDLNIKNTESQKTKGKKGSKSFDNINYTKLFINLGTKDGFYKASFLQFILDMSGLSKDNIGKIDMRDTNSWVEVESGVEKKMMKSLDGKNYRGRKIRMNEADTFSRKRKK